MCSNGFLAVLNGYDIIIQNWLFNAFTLLYTNTNNRIPPYFTTYAPPPFHQRNLFSCLWFSSLGNPMPWKKGFFTSLRILENKTNKKKPRKSSPMAKIRRKECFYKMATLSFPVFKKYKNRTFFNFFGSYRLKFWL